MKFDKEKHVRSSRKAYAKLTTLWKAGFVNLGKEGMLKLLTSEQLFELAVHIIEMLIETETIPDGKYEEVCERIFESLITIDEDDEIREDEDGLIDTEERDFLLEIISTFKDKG